MRRSRKVRRHWQVEHTRRKQTSSRLDFDLRVDASRRPGIPKMQLPENIHCSITNLACVQVVYKYTNRATWTL